MAGGQLVRLEEGLRVGERSWERKEIREPMRGR